MIYYKNYRIAPYLPSADVNAVIIRATRTVTPTNSITVISLLGSLARKYESARITNQIVVKIQLNIISKIITIVTSSFFYLNVVVAPTLEYPANDINTAIVNNNVPSLANSLVLCSLDNLISPFSSVLYRPEKRRGR